MKKVLQVSRFYYPQVGGVQKIVQAIAEELNKKEDFEVEVLCTQPKGRGKIEEINKIKVYRAQSWGIFWGLPFSLAFFRLFKKLASEVDLIDFHYPFPLGDLAIFLFKPKTKLVVHYHSDIVKQNIFSFCLKFLFFHTLKKAERIIVSNPNLLKTSSSLRKFLSKCQVMPFGVDLEKLEIKSEETIEKIKKKYGNFVLFVGRLVYYKGLEYLIPAMKKIEGKLVIIGEGPLRKALTEKVKRLRLDNKIFFLGFMDNQSLINFYWACSVLVLPSSFRSEGFGLVLAEAMATGRPVISTELGTGTSFVNRHQLTGIVVPPRSSRALILAIEKILKDKKLAEKFGQRARERIKRKFSLREMLEKLEKMYRFLLY